MHDPLVVAFEIRRPWPKRHRRLTDDGPRWRIGRSAFWTIAGRTFYWPCMITVWHREPRGQDSGTVCKQASRYQDADGRWQWRFHPWWRFHVHHWKIQVGPLQELRRRLLTRCAWCGQGHRRRDPVNIRSNWDGRRAPWWRGERGLYHSDCSMIENAHRSCLCDAAMKGPEWGHCYACGKPAVIQGRTADQLALVRRLAQIPAGGRDPGTGPCR